MRELEQMELEQIVGGVSISASFLNALARGIDSFLDVGRSLGSAIRRMIAKDVCPID